MANREPEPTGVTPERARQIALRAVTRITFTMGLVGCIEHAPGVDSIPDDPALGADGDLMDGDPWVDAADVSVGLVDAMVDGAGDGRVEADMLADAFGEPDGGPVVDADPGDAVVWSETTPCPTPQEDPEGWQACCEAHNWDGSDPNCGAWGPPMPPAMVA